MIEIAAKKQQLVEWFDLFHQNAEVSWKEFETTKLIAQILTDLQVPYRLFDGIPGLVAEIGKGEEVIAVRADIDALWQEVDGQMRANHSCGHDANITMVLGALVELKEMNLNKRVRFIFQPAEESGGGALETVKQNVLEGVTHLFGVHLRPIEELPLGKVTPAIHHGAAIFMQGKVFGVDAHGARPHQGQNAIDVIIAINQFVKTINIDPFEAASVKMTKIHADGGSVNIIPGNGEFSLDIRAQKNEVLHSIIEKLEKGIESISELFGMKIECEWLDSTPGALVSEDAARIAELSIIEALGMDALAPQIFTPGSDDFHYYTVMQPELKAAMIGIGANLAPGLHHPYMTFDKQALNDGVRVVATTLKNAANVLDRG